MPQAEQGKPGLLDRVRATRQKRKSKASDRARVRRERDAERAARQERKGFDGAGGGYGGGH
jgi:hypothetical protein